MSSHNVSPLTLLNRTQMTLFTRFKTRLPAENQDLVPAFLIPVSFFNLNIK